MSLTNHEAVSCLHHLLHLPIGLSSSLIPVSVNPSIIIFIFLPPLALPIGDGFQGYVWDGLRGLLEASQLEESKLEKESWFVLILVNIGRCWKLLVQNNHVITFHTIITNIGKFRLKQNWQLPVFVSHFLVISRSSAYRENHVWNKICLLPFSIRTLSLFRSKNIFYEMLKALLKHLILWWFVGWSN